MPVALTVNVAPPPSTAVCEVGGVTIVGATGGGGNTVSAAWTGSVALTYPFTVMLDVNGTAAVATVAGQSLLITFADASPFPITISDATSYRLAVNSDI